jgi:hypothetical protein
MEDGGYRTPTLWPMDGFAAAGTEQWRAPGHWRRIDGEWRVMTLGGLQPVDVAARSATSAINSTALEGAFRRM